MYYKVINPVFSVRRVIQYMLQLPLLSLRPHKTSTNTNPGETDIQVDLYPHVQTYFREIWGYLHKGINFCIKTSIYRWLQQNDIFWAWIVALRYPQTFWPVNGWQTILFTKLMPKMYLKHGFHDKIGSLGMQKLDKCSHLGLRSLQQAALVFWL